MESGRSIGNHIKSSPEWGCANSASGKPEQQTENQIPAGNTQDFSGNPVYLHQRASEQCAPLPKFNGGEASGKSQEGSLCKSFRQLCDGSTLPGKGIRASEPKLLNLLKESLPTINEIHKNIQKNAEKAGTGNCEEKQLMTLDMTDIQVPASQTGRSRLASGKMGFDMELEDTLLEEPFYKALLSVKGTGLEIGAGYGELCRRVLGKGNISRLDCNEPQITQLLSILARVSKSQSGNLEKLTLIDRPFPGSFSESDSSIYDFIICHRVFSVTSAINACKIIDTAFRLLKPGGQLFLLSLCDQHPGFQKNIVNKTGNVIDQHNGLIEVAASKALPDQDYNLPRNVTFIAQSPFAQYLKEKGFIINDQDRDISFPSTTRIAGTNSDKGARNIAFIVQKPESAH